MNWFKANETLKAQPTAFRLPRDYSDAGVEFPRPAVVNARESILPGELNARAFLDQLADLGFGEHDETRVLLPWQDVYEILRDDACASSLHLLALPDIARWRAALESRGALTDADFKIRIQHWIDANGKIVEPVPTRLGAVLSQGGADTLMPRELWQAISAIADFARMPEASKNQKTNRKAWGQIRRLAEQASCALDHFLASTKVLDVHKLSIDLRRVGTGTGKVTEVMPTFEEAPEKWLATFDGTATVQDRYDILVDGGIVQVLVAPDAQTVLREIKKMPNRRVAGARAEAFERNPYAALGPAAASVIDIAQFEQARVTAGIGITEFTAMIKRDGSGMPVSFALQTETMGGGDISVDESEFADAAEVKRFIKLFQNKDSKQFQCLAWKGFDLEILERTRREVDRLALALQQVDKSTEEAGATTSSSSLKGTDVTNQDVGSAQAKDKRGPTTVQSDTVLDISQLCNPLNIDDIAHLVSGEDIDLTSFSARIAGLGTEPMYNSPYIAKKDDDMGWFPENIHEALIPAAQAGADSGGMLGSAVDRSELKAALQEAIRSNSELVTIPGVPEPMPVLEAAAALKSFEAVAASGSFFDDELPALIENKKIRKPTKGQGQLRLVLRANIEQIDYSVKRGTLSETVQAPILPQALLPTVQLREHQRYGVAWLQNLWNRSPHDCNGALLADDMGLGKTLQLLTFVQQILESEPQADPFLIVAPVSLLINWEQEAKRFFGDGTIRMLQLHGDHLRDKTKSKEELDRETVGDNLVNQLKSGWLGNAKVVLTTYDTVRNLEFSLATQRWSAIICDEAQKIKYPGTMATRSMKKQNARFFIACTGTPVENTLVDLWCLFDFIQPGLLGSLKEFGATYRSPIEAKTDEQRAKTEELRQLIEPQILRRLKSDVAKDLPNKIFSQECRNLPLNSEQVRAYREAISPIHAAKQTKTTVPGIHLAVLHKLKKICSDPTAAGRESTDGDSVDDIKKRSPKMAFLINQLSQIKKNGEKAIVFCEFLDLQSTLQRVISWEFGIKPDIINGSTSTAEKSNKSRQKRIDVFQSTPGFHVLILSPIAVGFGVNIQAANHVVHFTRTWNPAKEDQATDRAYRIGQTKDVHVYCPVITSTEFETFDAKLDRLLERKRQLSGDMLNGSGDVTAADFDDLIAS